MGVLIGKVWGTTELLLDTPVIQIHRLNILPNRQCSLHAHKYKWNFFVVLSGRLTIEVEKNNYALTDRTVLKAGDATTVAPNEYHRFISHEEAALAIELYYPEPLSDDIVRKNVGGIVQALEEGKA